MPDQSIKYQNATIFYRVTGNGKPVILLHGFGEDAEIWNRQVDFLKAHFTLIIPDLPGSGKSEIVADMSIEGMAAIIKEIMNIELQKRSLQSAVVIGHSMGGYITLALVEKYPASIQAFGLVHSSAFADSEEKKAARLKSIEFIKANGSYEFLKTSIPGLFMRAQNALQQPDPEIDSLIEQGHNFSPEALISYYNAMIARPDRTAVLKSFLQPVLFVIGQQDKAIPFEQSMQQCYLPNLSYVHILRNSAHMGMWEETDKVNAALLNFLQG